jgi:methanogenic corrinoid protein MtbC1
MAPEERLIAFDRVVLDEVERHVAATGGSLSSFVDAAVRAELSRASLPADLEGAPAAAYSTAYLQALLDRDVPRARAVADGAVAALFPIADVYAEVLQPALAQIGHLWAVEEITVAQEHFATAVTQRLIAQLAPAVRTPPTEGRLAVVSTTPRELHVLGALMVADLLERDGWEVISLGASTPAVDLADLADHECPDLVALSASTAGRLPGVAEALSRLTALRPRPFLVVGGALFTGEMAEAAREMGADLVLTDVRALAPALLERFGGAAGAGSHAGAA